MLRKGDRGQQTCTPVPPRPTALPSASSPPPGSAQQPEMRISSRYELAAFRAMNFNCLAILWNGGILGK